MIFILFPQTAVPLSEDDFVEEVHGSGVLVYLSSTWLCEVYQQVLTTSILEIGGYQPSIQEQNALVNLLIGETFKYPLQCISTNP